MAKSRSRLRKQEEAKALKQTLFFSGLTIGLIILFIFAGLPLLIRLSVFLGDLRGKTPISEEKKGDKIAPMAPRLNFLPEAVNKAQIEISGFSEGKSQVLIILNGEKIQDIKVKGSGEFTSKKISLKKGENEIKAYALDETGNKSSFTETIFIVYDDEEPVLEISQPQDGQVFSGSNNKAEIKGTTESGAKVYINEILAIVNLHGEFSKIINLVEGETQIKIKVEDKAGNTTEKEIKVSYYH